jgi:hypothetical protein
MQDFDRMNRMDRILKRQNENVEIPESIAELLPRDPQGRARSVLEGLVIGAYTAGVISRGRAFELLGLNHWNMARRSLLRAVT